ncbi:hypothetical protein AV521_02710 [Streptomyces sp. IMTB 2501]|nr:hypothetical protein AV521_02710 [Streptomyces sp. IMTB 2501]
MAAATRASTHAHRVAPLCTPLATHAPHAVGLAYAARYRGEDTVALVLLGDGATSEGDFHAALNFAAVLATPVVFVVQNNGYAISVPSRLQSAAVSFAHKGIGYGIPAEIVDRNDVLAVMLTVRTAVERARAGAGPALIEAVTYRVGPHSSADNPARYRDASETAAWRQRDPLERFTAYLTHHDLLTAEVTDGLRAAAHATTARLRARVDAPYEPDLRDLTAHVYTRPPPHLTAQATEFAGRKKPRA